MFNASSTSDTQSQNTGEEQLVQARQLWFSARTRHDLFQVEAIYRRIWNDANSSTLTQAAAEQHSIASRTENSTIRTAGERLALLLLQSGRVHEADELLCQLNYTCRLSSEIFHYEVNKVLKKLQPSMQTATSCLKALVPCQVKDNFLPQHLLKPLQEIFCPIDASYWTHHQYQVEPPSPYFSYVVPLDTCASQSLIGQVIRLLYQEITATFQPVLSKAAFCEFWAHNRPLPTGHQLHFDTDNEGNDTDNQRRHPLVTAIIYLNGSSHDDLLTGGPTLITNQRLVSPHAADHGWLASVQENRVVFMEGRVLHCVVPGHVVPVSSNSTDQQALSTILPPPEHLPSHDRRRVTLMMAFWKRIRVRDEPTLGAARPLPCNNNPSVPSWAQALWRPVLLPITLPHDDTNVPTTEAQLVPVSPVYESVPGGEPWTRQMGLPSYDQVFQGV